MDADEVTLRPEKAGIRVPVGWLVSLSILLISGTMAVMAIVYSMKDSIRSNIEQNNINQERQTVLLKLIVCQNRWQLYHGREPSARYNGECE